MGGQLDVGDNYMSGGGQLYAGITVWGQLRVGTIPCGGDNPMLGQLLAGDNSVWKQLSMQENSRREQHCVGGQLNAGGQLHMGTTLCMR